MLDGEIMVREIVHAKRFARDVLECELPTAQHSDLPGHTPQTPQLLAKAGVKYFSCSRFRPYSPVYWWQAPDGSRVLAANHMNTYGWAFMLTNPDMPWLRHYEGEDLEVQSISEAMRIWPLPVLLMMGQSDLRPPIPEDLLARAKQLNDEGKLNFTFATITDFFEAAERTGKLDDLPVYGGQSPYAFYALPAVAPRVYLEARHAENALASAEKLSAIRGLLGLGAYPRAELDPAWEDLYNCHDHNLGGRHGELNNDVRYKTAVHARMIGMEIAREANNQFATHVQLHATQRRGVHAACEQSAELGPLGRGAGLHGVWWRQRIGHAHHRRAGQRDAVPGHQVPECQPGPRRCCACAPLAGGLRVLGQGRAVARIQDVLLGAAVWRRGTSHLARS